MKHSGIPLSSLNPKVQEQVKARLYGTEEKAAVMAGGLTIKQAHKKVSKLQRDFVWWLQSSAKMEPDGGPIILEEAITLEIANGCRYRPDAWSIHPTLMGDPVRPLSITAWEVKGPHAWDDSIVKLKVAARAFPWITFNLVTRKDRLAAWSIVKVEP